MTLSGKWQVASGKWQVASGKWQVASRKWQVASGKSQVASRKWQVASRKSQVASRKSQVASRKSQVAFVNTCYVPPNDASGATCIPATCHFPLAIYLREMMTNAYSLSIALRFDFPDTPLINCSKFL